MWLDQFYLSNITPLFFVETLADLEKGVRKGRTPEEVVGSLAYKTPDYSSKPNAHHRGLMSGELFYGEKLDLQYGRPHITGGKTVELGDRHGVLFEPSPEEEAFSRWQDLKFLELERHLAKKWREALSNIDFELQYSAFQTFYPLGKPKTLAEVKKFLDFYIDGPDQESVLIFGLSVAGVSAEGASVVLKRWRDLGKLPVREFAPYFTHVFSVDFFFYLAIAADIIGRGRPSHKIDLAYLYYLPFCNVFTSRDKLHADIAPFFMRDDQTFVNGKDLKDDLAKLDAHYSAFSEEEKARGVVGFAHYPPKEGDFLTAQLWDKYMSPKWREREMNLRPQPDSEIAKHVREEMQRMEEAPAIQAHTPSDKADSMVLRRMVRGHKGKWTRFPPEVMNRRRNAAGEWEDIPPEES